MKLKIITLVIFAFTFCSSVFAEDSIDALATKLNSDKFGLWVNGGSPILGLSSDVSINAVIDKATHMISFGDEGKRIENYSIVEIRKVDLKAQPNCSAALLKTNLGQKILLFKYVGTDWWTRFFDVPQNKPNQSLEAIETTPGN